MLPRERWWLSLCPPVAGWKPEIPSWTDIILYFFIGRTKKVIHLTNGLHCHGNVRCGEGEGARVWERGRVVLQANLLTLQQRSVVEIWVRSSRPAKQSKVSLKVSFFKDFLFFLNYMYMLRLSVLTWMQDPEKDIISPGAEATGSCELSDVGTTNRTRILCKSSKCS